MHKRLYVVGAVAGVVLLGGAWAGGLIPRVSGASPDVAAVDAASGARAALPGSAPEAKDAATAMALAVKQGVPVEDVSQREATHEVFAQPDGMWLARDWLSPVWVDQAADGSSNPKWALLDTDLAAAQDGRIAPKAVPGGLSFSAGGARSDIATWRVPGSDVTVTLVSPVETLPEPVVEGSRLRYLNIAPGVDLVVDVRPSGFEQFFVVHDRGALDGLRGAVSNVYRVEGGSARAAGDTVEIVDASSVVVATIPQPMVWDATSDRSMVNPVLTPWVRADVTPSDSSHLDEVPDLTPASIEVDASGSEYTVRTIVDPAWAKSGDRVFPLVIDPVLWNPALASDTYVETYHTETYRGAETEMLLGRVPGGVEVYRPYVGVDAGTLKNLNLDLDSAVLVLWNYWSATCTPQWYHAYWTYAPDASTNWNHQPAIRYGDAMWSTETRGHTSGVGSYCSQGWSGMDILPLVKMWQTDTQQYEGLMLTTGDETLTARWKRFYSAESSSPYKPHIDYVYNQRPDTPSGLVYTPPTATTQGVLKAVVSDPDGSSVRAAFTIERRPIGSSAPWETMVDKQEGSLVASGGTSTRSVDLIAGFEYRFTASGYDGRIFSLAATAAVTYVNPATGVFIDLPATNDSQASAMDPLRINAPIVPNATTVEAVR